MTFGFGSNSELFLSDPESHLCKQVGSFKLQTKTHSHKAQKLNLESDSTIHCVDLESKKNQEPTKEQNIRNL